METRIKCNLCRRMKFPADFLKNGKTLKSCIACRTKKKEGPLENVIMDKLAIMPKEVPLENVTNEPTLVIMPKEVPLKKWCVLSGRWLKHGDERRLHKMLIKKVMRELIKKAALPIHKYLTKELFVDIRDRYTSE
jgi:hypothetical protein